jgi:hypothetical protein
MVQASFTLISIFLISSEVLKIYLYIKRTHGNGGVHITGDILSCTHFYFKSSNINLMLKKDRISPGLPGKERSGQMCHVAFPSGAPRTLSCKGLPIKEASRATHHGGSAVRRERGRRGGRELSSASSKE